MNKHNKRQGSKKGASGGKRKQHNRKRTPGFSGPMANYVPFPERKSVVLNYCENNTVTISAGPNLYSWHYFQTSLYDPRGSIGGHQPLYFDQLSAIYAYYRVDRVQYSVTFDVFQANSANCASGMAYVGIQKLPAFVADVQQLEEKPYVARSGISMYTGPRTIRGAFNPYTVLGVPKRKYADENDYSATCGANPNLMAYIVPYVYNGSNAAYAVGVRIELKFHCTFYQLLPVTSS